MDSIPSVGLILAFVGVSLWRTYEAGSVRLRAVWQTSIPTALALMSAAGVFTFQRLYYGHWLPNTYFLKVEGVSAAARVEVGFRVFKANATLEILPLLLVVVAGIVAFRKLRSNGMTLGVVLVLTACTYSIWVGGDYAEPQVHAANRFIVPSLGVLMAGFAAVAAQTIRVALGTQYGPTACRRYSMLMGLVVAAVALYAVTGRGWKDWATNNAPLLRADIRRARIGDLLVRATTVDAVIAAHACGQIPYFSRRTTIDMLGKSDAYIARERPRTHFRPGHNKWDYDYAIGRRRPDVVADEWGRVRTYLTRHGGYQRLASGTWIRRGSPRVDAKLLSTIVRY